MTTPVLAFDVSETLLDLAALHPIGRVAQRGEHQHRRGHAADPEPAEQVDTVDGG